VLVLVSLALLQFFPVVGEFVEQVINNVRLEDLHTLRVCQFLRVLFDFHVKREDRSVSANKLNGDYRLNATCNWLAKKKSKTFVRNLKYRTRQFLFLISEKIIKENFDESLF